MSGGSQQEVACLLSVPVLQTQRTGAQPDSEAISPAGPACGYLRGPRPEDMPSLLCKAQMSCWQPQAVPPPDQPITAAEKKDEV